MTLIFPSVTVSDTDYDEPLDLFDALHDDPDDAALSRARAALIDDEEREREERVTAAREASVVGDDAEIEIVVVRPTVITVDENGEETEAPELYPDDEPEPEPEPEPRPRPRPAARRGLTPVQREARRLAVHLVHSVLSDALERIDAPHVLRDERFEPRPPRLTSEQLREVRRINAAKARAARAAKRRGVG